MTRCVFCKEETDRDPAICQSCIDSGVVSKYLARIEKAAGGKYNDFNQPKEVLRNGKFLPHSAFGGWEVKS